MHRALLLTALTTLAALAPLSPAQAHPTHNGTFVANVLAEQRRIEVLLSIISQDLGANLKLDTDGNNVVDGEEIKAGEERIFGYYREKLQVTNAGTPCAITGQRLVQIEVGDERARTHAWLEVTCEAPLTRLAVTLTALFEDEGGYRHYGRVQVGEAISSVAFNPEFPTTTIEVAPPPAAAGTAAPSSAPTPSPSLPQTLLFYLWEGILHIITGYDHVLFVVCLLLVARHFKHLAATITAFTVGHSVTLVLSALDVVTVAPRIIESVIALSIAWVAVENAIDPAREPRWRFLVTGAFGLVHGFGFSYVLRDEVGLPTEALVPALVTFNLGVELGQLAIVAVCWPILRAFMDKSGYRYAVWIGSGLVLVLALYWFIERAFLA